MEKGGLSHTLRVRMAIILQEDEEFARRLQYGKKQLLLTVAILILSWPTVGLIELA